MTCFMLTLIGAVVGLVFIVVFLVALIIKLDNKVIALEAEKDGIREYYDSRSEVCIDKLNKIQDTLEEVGD